MRSGLKFAMRPFLSVGAGVVVILAFLIISIRSIENRFIYFPPQHRKGFNLVEQYSFSADEVWFKASDGVKLSALYRPNPESRKVIVRFHGNAEDLSSAAGVLNFYSAAGASVLALDYRGYGKSEGSPYEEGLYRDADAAYDYLVKQRHVSPQDIILLGHSLGGVVAIDLASRRPCGGLVVESSLTSAREMARRILRIPLLGYRPRTRFDSLSKVAQVRAPVLIVHGTDDNFIPFSMGRRLFESASQPKEFYGVEGAGHDDLLEVAGADYRERLKRFIRFESPARAGRSSHATRAPGNSTASGFAVEDVNSDIDGGQQ